MSEYDKMDQSNEFKRVQNAYQELITVLGKKNKEIEDFRSKLIVQELQITILEQNLQYAKVQLMNVHNFWSSLMSEIKEIIGLDKDDSSLVHVHLFLNNILLFMAKIQNTSVDWTLHQFSPSIDRGKIIRESYKRTTGDKILENGPHEFRKNDEEERKENSEELNEWSV